MARLKCSVKAEAYNPVPMLGFFGEPLKIWGITDTRDCRSSVMKTLYRNVNEALQGWSNYSFTE